MRRPGLLASALLLLAVHAPRLAEAARLAVEHEGRRGAFDTVLEAGEEYLDLDDVAGFFDLEPDRSSRKDVVLSGAFGRIEVRVGRALVRVNGQPVLLRTEVIARRGRTLVPLDFPSVAVGRLLGVDARMDEEARVLRFERGTPQVACETFADRTRVSLRTRVAPEIGDVMADGRRRVVVLANQELPLQQGGCVFDETLADLEVRPAAGQTRITFFVGPRFTNLRIHELPESLQVVFDFFNDAGAARPALAEAAPAGASDVFDTVVIDPGHGGADEGAIGAGGLREKDLVLAVALETARLIRERAGLDVTLTRSSDEAVSLADRTAVANRARADLFLSIHANATVASQAFGAETYYLDAEATDESARALAAMENDATGLRGRGGEAGGDLEILLWDLAQQQYLGESSALAESVQAELNRLAGTRDRGVRQANFAVLRGATMPAVLVEVGFLSNPREERAMAGAEFRRATAEALVRAVLAFRDRRQARQRR